MKIIDTKDLLQHTELLEKNNEDIKIIGTIHGSQLEFLKNIYADTLDVTDATPGGIAELKSFKGIKYLILSNKMDEIRDFDFSFCPTLERICISKSISHIGQQSFSYSNRLTKIDVNEENKHFTSVGGILFNKNMGTLVRCPEGIYEAYTVPEGTERIREYAFCGCNGLKNIYLPSTLKEIEEGAFQGCEGLEEIILPENIKKIESNTFFGCKNLKKIILPNTLLEIEKGAFFNCENLEAIELPQQLTKFEKAFENCYRLASISIRGGNGIHYYSRNGVVYDKERRELTIAPLTIRKCTVEESIQDIGPRSFESTLIEDIHLPNSLNTIKNMAFRGCYGLTSITLPVNTKKIEERAFDSCTNLKRIECKAIQPPTASASSFSFMPCDETSIVVPKQSIEQYKTSEGWNLFKNIISQN